MEVGRRDARHSASFWLFLLGATVLLSLEPAFSLVLLALGLSALAVVWIVMLLRFAVLELLSSGQASRCPAANRNEIQ